MAATRARRGKHSTSDRRQARVVKQQQQQRPCDLAALARQFGVPYLGPES